jgi:hypothetical protein
METPRQRPKENTHEAYEKPLGDFKNRLGTLGKNSTNL